MWVMSAITGLMYGTQYFQADDKPLYARGLSIMIGVVSAGLLLVGIQLAIYWNYNRKVIRENREGDESKDLALYTL
jgi:hypothetical protein